MSPSSPPPPASLGPPVVLGDCSTTTIDLNGALSWGRVLRGGMIHTVLDSLLKPMLQRLKLQGEVLDLAVLVCQDLKQDWICRLDE